MKGTISNDINEVLHTVHYRPAVSIIIPFQTKISLKTELDKELKFAVDKVAKKMDEHYPQEQTTLILDKLNNLIANLQLETNKKALVIYISPIFQKYYFLDAKVEAKIIIDDSFEIRDLVYDKKSNTRFLLFLLSVEYCQLYMGAQGELTPVPLASSQELKDYVNTEVERVSNFTSPAEFKETQVEKFMRQMDKELGQVLNSQALPVFLMGSKTILGLFNTITHHEKHIAGLVDGNYEGATPVQLEKALQPVLLKWKRKEQQQLLVQIEKAATEKKMSFGIQDVWKAANEKKGRLLIVERNYMAAGEHISNDKIIYKPTGEHNEFHYSHDVVDDVIEQVLKNGGDVAFVDQGVLAKFQHVVLLQFY
jgi:hypothetical protein